VIAPVESAVPNAVAHSPTASSELVPFTIFVYVVEDVSVTVLAVVVPVA
jgi:hypothetical protein